MKGFKNLITVLSAGTVAASVLSCAAFAGDVSGASAGLGESASKTEAISVLDDESSSVITQRFPLTIEQKINDLKNLGIVEGDPDGNFRLDSSLSRAEFAKISCLMLGLDSNISQESLFHDVGSDHWANGYITTARKCGIINGYEDGTFRPDNEVALGEAVKMIISALGYTPMAESRGGYPGGFMYVAGSQGFDVKPDADSEAAINRETAFDLVHYALDVPLMEQTGFGENVEYSIMNGKDDIAYRTLRTCLLEVNEVEYSEMPIAMLKQFASDNEETIKADVDRYWKRMKYEGEYTYEVLNAMQNESGTDVIVKVALFDETESRYINLTLNYKYVNGQIR